MFAAFLAGIGRRARITLGGRANRHPWPGPSVTARREVLTRRYTGSAASIPHTDEWTYTPGTSKLSPAPSGWCLTGTSTCARFFGGVSRSDPEALMWQWSGGGGITNGIGDFDQIDANRQR